MSDIFSRIKPLLFDNLSIRQTISKNIFWLGVTEGVSKFAKLILLIYIARILGATEYGNFTFSLSFVSLFILFFDFGLSQITTREFSKSEKEEKEFSSIFSLKFFLGIGSFFLILITSFFISPNSEIQKIILILGACFFIESLSEIIVAFFRARQQMQYEAFIKILGSLTLVGIGLGVLFYSPSTVNLSYSYLFGALISLLIAFAILHFKIQKLSFCWNKSVWKRYLSLSWSLGFVGILSTLYNQIDSVMMGYLGQFTQTGWYNAAYRLVWPTLIPMSLISVSLFPIMSKYFEESKEKLQKVWDNQMEIMIFLAVPLVLGGVAIAPKIIGFVYNQSYLSSVSAFQILIIMAGIMFVYSPFYQILIVANQQKRIFWAVLIGSLVNITLNIFLIPEFSLYGAALSTIITHSLIFLFLFIFSRKYTPIKSLSVKTILTLIYTIIAGFFMYFILIQDKIYDLPLLVLILVGIVIYSLVVFIFKYVLKYFSL